MIVFAMALFNTCDHKVTENRTKNPRQNQNMDAEGESLNKCSGFGAILFIRAGGCDVYRLVGRLRCAGS